MDRFGWISSFDRQKPCYTSAARAVDDFVAVRASNLNNFQEIQATDRNRSNTSNNRSKPSEAITALFLASLRSLKGLAGADLVLFSEQRTRDSPENSMARQRVTIPMFSSFRIRAHPEFLDCGPSDPLFCFQNNANLFFTRTGTHLIVCRNFLMRRPDGARTPYFSSTVTRFFETSSQLPFRDSCPKAGAIGLCTKRLYCP